jgi:AmiR/NasT family two-component response regulator
VTAGEPGDELLLARADLAAAVADAEGLQRALVTSRRIGMAMGILMERHRLTAEEAFDQLRDLSQGRNVKLRELAEQIIYTGDTERRRD